MFRPARKKRRSAPRHSQKCAIRCTCCIPPMRKARTMSTRMVRAMRTRMAKARSSSSERRGSHLYVVIISSAYHVCCCVVNLLSIVPATIFGDFAPNSYMTSSSGRRQCVDKNGYRTTSQHIQSRIWPSQKQQKGIAMVMNVNVACDR
jgi:hypothetical protein